MPTARARAKSVPPAPKQSPSSRHWGLLFGEWVLLFLLVVAPVVVNRYSRNTADVKEATLGLGVFLGLAVWLVISLAKGRLIWPSSRLSALLFAFLGWATVSVLYSHFWVVSISDLGRLLANVGVFCLALVCVRSYEQVRRLVIASAISALLVCIYAFVQATGHELLGVHWSSDQGGRVFSFLGNATYLAGYLLLVLPLLAAVTWTERTAPRGEAADAPRRSWLPLAFLTLMVAVVVVTLLLSFTFAAVGGLLLGLVYATVLLLARGERKTLRTVVLAGLAALLVFALIAPTGYRHLPRRQQQRVDKLLRFQDPSSTERQLHWRVAYQMFRQYPLFGEGYSTFRVAALPLIAGQWYAQRGTKVEGMLTLNHAHNEYLQVLAETGLIGGLLFFAFLLTALGLAFRVSLRHPDPRWRRLGLAITVAAIGFLFQNLFGLTFRVAACAMFFWLWLGLLVVAGAQLPRPKGAPPAVRIRSFRPWGTPALALLVLFLAVVFWGLAVTALRPLYANVRLRLAQKLASQGQYEAAVVVAHEVLDVSPYSAMAYYTLAYASAQLGQYQEAIRASDEALRLAPGNASICYNLGVMYKQQGKLEEAAAQFQKAIDLMPVADNYIGLAETRLQQGRLDEAEQLAGTALRKQSAVGGDTRKVANLYLMLADIASRRRDLPRVISHLQQAASFNPGDANIESQLIDFLRELHRPAEALHAAQMWAAADPQSLEALKRVASLHYELRHYAEAKGALERALALDEGDLQLRLNLAYCYAQLKDLPNFRRQLEEVVRLGGTAPEAQTARHALAGLPR